MREGFRYSLLLILMLNSLALLGGQPVSISPAYDGSNPENVHISYANNHTITDLTVTDPEKAHDEILASYAVFDYSEASGNFELYNFSSPILYPANIRGSLPTISRVDFKFRYNTTANQAIVPDDKYRILYYVSPSPTAQILVDWTDTAVTLGTYTWSNQPEPNDGTWDWTDVNNIRFVVETLMIGSMDPGCQFKEYEAWVEVVYPLGKLAVGPSSIIDYTLDPIPPVTIRPNGDGKYAQWDGTYVDWDEEVANGDTDYVSVAVHGSRESSLLEDVIPHPTWTIGRVRLVAYAAVNETTDDGMILMLVVAGTARKATKVCYPTTSYERYTWDWAVNPATGSKWTWADIDALEAGVESRRVGDLWTGQIKVTQLYVEVTAYAFQVDIYAEGVLDVWGWEFKLWYDTAVLTATLSTPNPDFPDISYNEIDDEFNSTHGLVWISSSLPMSTYVGLNGNLTLAIVEFSVDFRGRSDLDIDESFPPKGQLGTPELEAISVTIADGYFRNTLIGDVDGDGDVDGFDLTRMCGAYGSTRGDPGWDEPCDMNGDGIIDGFDLTPACGNYGKTI